MNRRGLLCSLMSLVPACFVPAKSRMHEQPHGGLVDANGRYLSCPVAGTEVYLVGDDSSGDVGQTCIGRVIWGSADFALVACVYSQWDHLPSGQVHQTLYCRRVKLSRESMLTVGSIFKSKT